MVRKFGEEDLKVMELWYLCCQDMAIPEGGCQKCEFKDMCENLRKLLMDFISYYPWLREKEWQFKTTEKPIIS